MPSEHSSEVKFEIGHVLFIDIIGYSKLLINEQSEQIQTLKEIVRGTEQFRLAEAEGKLVRLPTGDGGALVFRNSPEAPVLCALEISKALKNHPELHVRMGIHSGPVNEVVDLNEQSNIAGAGINMAQRVMDCGDAGHILVSRHVAADLEHYPRWQECLHDLGECEVKHGVLLGVVNLYRDGIGNPQLPNNVRASRIRQSRRRWTAIAAAITFLVVAGAVFLFFSRAKSIVAAPMRSVAVLPLVNSSGDPNNEYFSDGLSDELIAILAKIPGLKVIGRNSSFLFKGKPGDSASIGQRLGVAQLIQGSVLRQGNHVRIIAEMIRASDGAALWSETYDREVKDVFAIQSDIAQAVAAQLKIKLLGEKPASDSARSNPNPAAHDALLQAVSFNDGSAEGERKAIRYAEEAVGLDPNYAAAWATVAELWRGYAASDASEDEIDRAYTKARIAAEKAFALDPNSVDALIAMYGMAFTPGLDFAAAEKYARRAVELAPGNVDCLGALSSALVAEGRLQEAEPIRREMTAIDPLHAGWYYHGFILVGLRRYAEARAMFTKFLGMYPKAARVHTQFVTLDILENNPNGALEHAHLEQEGIWRDFATAMALEAGGDKLAADAALQAFINKYAKVASFQVAILYAQRHQPDEMFKWLETAYANRDGGLVRIFVIPFLMDYRDDPRFAAFCRKLGIEKLPLRP